jgi:hypothetical protein
MTSAEAKALGMISLMLATSQLGSTQSTVFPVVEFIPGIYVTVSTPKRVLVPCNEIIINNPEGKMKASRAQVPLILAW